jgi:hypothetical protein
MLSSYTNLFITYFKINHDQTVTDDWLTLCKLSRECTYGGCSNIPGTQNCLHVQNIEGVHLTLSLKLGIELWCAYREGMHL